MGQLLLLPNDRPLDQRLGRRFFREAPRRPGVYLMKDAEGRVLYVGKAKNLKERLDHYRIASPERMARRHLRMVREVDAIEFQFCPTEAAALAREARLLRSLRPRYNRAGVWPGRTVFVAWNARGETLELSAVETPATGWRRFGPLNGAGRHLVGALARLLWLALNPARPVTELPAGWLRGAGPALAAFPCGESAGRVLALLEDYFWATPEPLMHWLGEAFARRTTRFERSVITAELETLTEFAAKHSQPSRRPAQMALL